VGVALPTDDPERLRIGVARGVGVREFQDRLIPAAGSLSGRVFTGGQPQALDRSPAATGEGMPTSGRCVLAVPLIAVSRSPGILLVTRRPGRPVFSTADAEVVSDVASCVSVALELSGAAVRQAELRLPDLR